MDIIITISERNELIRKNISLPKDLLPNITRNYYEYKPDGEIVAFIDRTYVDEIVIVLPCGYFQRFWIDCTDKQALTRVENMKQEGFKSAI